MVEDVSNSYATPYPWDDPEFEESQRQANQRLRKRPFVGSGLVALREKAIGTKSTMSEPAQDVLRNLLQQHGLDLENLGSDELSADAGLVEATLGRSAAPQGKADEKVLVRARRGEYSLFLSMLTVLESSDGNPIPSKTFMRTCCPILGPGDVPGAIDAKETILAALHFLSSRFQASSQDIIPLPLIKAVQEVADLEKRSWEKVGNWKLADIKEKLLHLEHIFSASPSSWRWLKREAFSPRLSQKDEAAFFLKGSIPASAAAKKSNREPTRKRKAAALAPAKSPEPDHEKLESP